MQATQARQNVDIDTRRKVFMAARARKPADVVKVPHESFIRNMLKDSLGWRRDQPAPETIKAVAKVMAQQFVERDKKLAMTKGLAMEVEQAKALTAAKQAIAAAKAPEEQAA